MPQTILVFSNRHSIRRLLTFLGLINCNDIFSDHRCVIVMCNDQSCWLAESGNAFTYFSFCMQNALESQRMWTPQQS